MSDLFHPDVPDGFIAQVFSVMHQTPWHTYQVLTKRPERMVSMSKQLWFTSNIWVGTSVESPAVLERIHWLQNTPVEVRLLLCEPLLIAIPRLPLDGIHWVIVGGESGPKARPVEADLVREIRDPCIAQGVPFFFKQWGAFNEHMPVGPYMGMCGMNFLEAVLWTRWT